MIDSLYPIYRRWSTFGSVYIISDLHFDDADCKLMDPNWISPEEHVKLINSMVHKNDTLIVLGDVGNVEWVKQLKAGHKVLVMGNHDAGAEKYQEKVEYKEDLKRGWYTESNHLFHEVYSGPIFIAEKILLSHEPINRLDWCFNIHGHDHNKKNKGDEHHLNVASNVCGYRPINLGELIKSGKLAHINSIHRETINEAIRQKRNKKNA